MTRREDELMAELRPLVAEIRKLGGYLERGGVPVRPAARPERLQARAVASRLPTWCHSPTRRRAPLTDIDRLKAKAAEISAELGDIIEAKKHLLPALNRARAEASAKVCDAVRPEYAAIAQRIAAALIELGEGWTAQTVFLPRTRGRGVFNFNPAADRDSRSGRPARHHRPRPALGCRVRVHQPERRAAGMAGPLISHNEQEHETMKSRELRARRAKLIEDARALISDKYCSAEETMKFDRMMAEADRLKGQIDRIEQVEAEEFKMLEAMRPINRSKAGIANPRGVFDPIAAFDIYLRGGLEALSPEARAVLDYQKFNAAMGTTTGRDGGFTVPDGFYRQLISAEKAIRRHA